MAQHLELEVVIPATPLEVFQAWLDPAQHAAFTGSPATGEAEMGATFTAWDGYIKGTHLALEHGKRIVQAWRTTEFQDHHPDSRVEVRLQAHGGGTLLLLRHEDIPEDQVDGYRQGWVEYYFDPLIVYFSKGIAPLEVPAPPRAPKKAKAPAKRKAAPKKAAARKTAAPKNKSKKAAGKKAKSKPAPKGKKKAKTPIKKKGKPGRK